MIEMPDVHFGKVGGSGVDWRKIDDPDPDDEELEVTPANVIAMLGFDPKEFSEED
jgi:hypothetical protein